MPQVPAHASSCRRSYWRVCWSCVVLISPQQRQSSVNRRTWDLTAEGRSVMWQRQQEWAGALVDGANDSVVVWLMEQMVMGRYGLIIDAIYSFTFWWRQSRSDCLFLAWFLLPCGTGVDQWGSRCRRPAAKSPLPSGERTPATGQTDLPDRRAGETTDKAEGKEAKRRW